MSVRFWGTVLFLLFVILEEAIYYSWNRYLYGKNIEMRQKWKTRILNVRSLFRRKKQMVIQHSDQEKSSS
ncbi:hypothetical protein [Neobacillus cucumis]|uniref:Uncharacterized protein n=1 Tax=Neobacillus cucumis TaxID=1740721 RepID=A0A2N5HP15_9BACI|nr:hypothetical protein [Neobacillus cucumis]PLS07217.1 hypothetical protein CVD27_05935 [Neobacillus cucumis]